MDIHIHEDLECSMCGAVNKTEIVEKGNNHWTIHCVKTFIRCTRCGHEKELYTTTNNSTGGPVAYTMPTTNPKQIF